MLPDGKILPEPGKHLDARQRLTRQKLVDAIEHIKAGGKTSQDAVGEYTREAAFTFLNRFVALRMLEARGMLQECVSKGDASSGFKEFCGLAPGLSSLDDGGYRLYLECLFDELSVEVKVLFDRRDSASLLWPRRGALTELLEVLGRAELTKVWIEDETIGWVFQYFNSREEIDELREISESPRNSLELAVRNQFFTPRYVVEFLTDNTLGRIWYEMRKGQTEVVNRCRYLVRQPNDVFLNEKEEVPRETAYVPGAVRIPHRQKKDPRDIKILDPACGSGHFLLYAFDLLISIYDEAWLDEASPPSEVTGRRLREDYPDSEQLHAALPGLVLSHNLYGIDIDPRAAQTAAFALWMRGQRAYEDFGVSRNDRRSITKSNLVCAEPMPGETDLINEVSKSLKPTILSQLLNVVVDKMKLAGEAGSLLRIEEELKDQIGEARRQWVKGPREHQHLLFDDGESESSEQMKFDFSGINDERFWLEAESRVIGALDEFATTGARDANYRRRLFAEDAAAGFSFIDVCRHRFDVVLMNPPFGDASLPSKPYIEDTYGDTKGDVFKAFVECFQDRLVPTGMLGIISSRTGFFLSTAQDWRERIVLRLYRPLLVADLGFGVLDAKVETAAYVLRSLSAQEDAQLTEDLIPELAKVSLDKKGYFSIPKYQAARGGLKRHQAVGELERLTRRKALKPIVGHYARFAIVSNESKKVETRITDEHEHRAIFVRLLAERQKAIALDDIVSAIQCGRTDGRLFDCPTSLFDRIPGKPFAYWLDEKICSVYASWPSFESESRTVKQGLATADDFRFVRLWWEVAPQALLDATHGPDWHSGVDEFQDWCRERTRGPSSWVTFAKGGIYTPYHADVPWVINWAEDGRELKAFTRSVVRNPSYYFRPALTYLSRTSLRLCATPLPAGSIFSHVGPAILPEPTLLHEALGRFNSYAAEACISPFHARGTEGDDQTKKYEVGLIQSVPWPEVNADVDQIKSALFEFQTRSSKEETGRSFVLDNWGADPSSRVCDAICNVEQSVARDYGLGLRESFLAAMAGGSSDADLNDSVRNDVRVGLAWPSVERQNESRLSYAVGCFFGRWDIRHVYDDAEYPQLPDAFEPLAPCPPGMLTNPEGLPAADEIHDYPLAILLSGIAVDDEGHVADVVAGVSSVLRAIYGDDSEEWYRSAMATISSRNAQALDLRNWLRRYFFDIHAKNYKRPPRKAPIYWQLGTASASFSIWLYYHRFTRDTFFQVLNDYVKPKLNHERQKLERMRSEGGAEPTRSQRKEIEDQEKFVTELAAMVEEVERIAPLWNPNLNDGVIINFAPLWRLVPQNKSWQKECKSCWDKLFKGEYDWAHLAMHLWPERVVPKCVTDASLAIAHGLEEVFWEQDDRDRFQPKEEPDGGWAPIIKELVDERTSPAVKAALESLLTAPAPAGNSKSRRRKATT